MDQLNHERNTADLPAVKPSTVSDKLPNNGSVKLSNTAMQRFNAAMQTLRHNHEKREKEKWFIIWEIFFPDVSPPSDIFTIYPSSTHQKTFRPVLNKPLQIKNQRKVIRILVNKQEHLACPDSGSEMNIISSSFAYARNYNIHRQPKNIRAFEVGNGKIVYSMGRVILRVLIPGHPMRGRKRSFFVLDNCPVSIVLGKRFLQETEILTVNRRFLENCPREMSEISELLWIGSPRKGNTMKCTIKGRELYGIADTGSDLNLMSLACAERERFTIDRGKEARSLIQVGNGEVIETVGQVYVANLGLDWRKPQSEWSHRELPDLSPHGPDTSSDADIPSEEDELEVVFYVVEDLPCDLIFGQQFLLDIDAFSRCPDLVFLPPPLINLMDELQDRPFDFKIFLKVSRKSFPFSLRKKGKPKPGLAVGAAITREQHENDLHAELGRRARCCETKIALLPVAERDVARREEAEKVNAWNTSHAACEFCCAV